MLLHVFRHVEADQRRLVVEQERGERLRQLGLADARGAEEHERADGPVRILQAGAGPAHGRGDRRDGFGLADDALGQILLHVQKLLALALQHLVDRHAGPARDDLRHVVGRHRLFHQAAAIGFRFDLRQLLLEPRNDPVGELARLRPIAGALRLAQLIAGLIELLLEIGRGAELVLLGLPARRDGGRLLFQIRQLLRKALEAVLGGGIGLLLQGFLLDLETHDLAVEVVELFRLRIDLHAQARGRLVDEIDGLVRQEAVGDIAVRERRCGHERRVGDAHAMMLLVLLLQAAQDRHGVLHRGLAHEDRLETTGQRRVLLHMLAVLIEGGRADAMQLAARQRRLQQVRGIHRAIGLAGADQRVHLIDEQDDAAFS